MHQLINKLIPLSIKVKIKSSKIYLKTYSRKLALTSKRLDICAAQISHVLSISKCKSLKGKVCLEVGSGWTLAYAIIFHLLGAKRIISTDIAPIAVPESLYLSINNSIISLVRDILSPFEEHDILRERLNHLLTIRHFNFEILQSIGIEYIAPVNLSKKRLNTPVDFIFSNSVLEYIPVENIDNMLKNLAADLKPSGTMIHCIHLEDHKNIISDPFQFLSKSKNEYSQVHHSIRLNRIRRSTWRNIFNKIEDSRSIFLYEWIRNDKNIPEIIDKSIVYEDEEDLKISHIGVLTKKINMNKRNVSDFE